MKKSLLILLVLFSCAASAFEAYLFFAPGCTNCGDVISMLTEAEKQYPDMHLHMLNIRFYENKELYNKIQQNYGPYDYNAPVFFIGDNVYIGYTDKIGEQIQSNIKYCSKNSCVSPLDKKFDPASVKSEFMNYFWVILGVVLVSVIVGWFIKKQMKSMESEVKPVTKKFFD